MSNNMRHEAKFHSKFRHYLQARVREPGVFEVKYAHNEIVYFKSLEEHQRESLLAAKHRCLTYKPPDDTRGFKPCDFLHFADVKAYVVLAFKKGFVLIDIDVWVQEERQSKRKSLTWERAKAIADVIEN